MRCCRGKLSSKTWMRAFADLGPRYVGRYSIYFAHISPTPTSRYLRQLHKYLILQGSSQKGKRKENIRGHEKITNNYLKAKNSGGRGRVGNRIKASSERFRTNKTLSGLMSIHCSLDKGPQTELWAPPPTAMPLLAKPCLALRLHCWRSQLPRTT